MKKGLECMEDNCIFFSFVCSVLTNKLFLLINKKSGEESMGKNYLQKFEPKMHLLLLTWFLVFVLPKAVYLIWSIS